MTKTEILQLVTDISAGKADPVTIDFYFDQLIDDLGRHSQELTAIELATATKGTAEYVLPDNCIVEQAVLFDDRQLIKTETNHLEAVSPSWRSHIGKPYAYTKDELTARSIRLYPIPDVTTGPITWDHGEPIGLDFPPNSITYIFSSRDASNIPYHLVLAIVFQILAWNFARPSKYKSSAFSQLCQQLAGLFFKLSGISWSSVGDRKEKA
jgi:hypothetical protein